MPKIQTSGYSYDFSDSSISGSIPIEVLDIAVSSATASLDFASGSFFKIDHNSNSTVRVEYSNEYNGMSIMVLVQHGASSSGSLEFGGNTLWPGGVEPSWTQAAASRDIVTLTCFEASEFFDSAVFANAVLNLY